MRFVTPICAGLLAAITVAHAGAIAADHVNFSRTFKDKEVTKYEMTMGEAGASDGFDAKVQTTVKGLLADGANVEYKALDFEAGGSPQPDTQDLTTKVGPSGMPSGAVFKDNILFVALGATGITPGATEEVGKEVSIHWTNDAKDVTVDASGKLTALDATAKTLTVDWKLTITPSGQEAGTITTTTVYSTDDFSLTSSKGTLSMQGKDTPFNVKRLPAN